MKTRILIVLRAGAGSLHQAWTHVCAGKVNVAISLFDDSPIDASAFVVTHRVAGPKFLGLQAFFAANPWVIDAYTHFWLFDDDLYLPLESLLTAQETVEQYGFTLCGPSLAPESFSSWPITIQNTAFHLRATDFVEIMAPIMSRDFLRKAMPHFAENHTGWGYEWLWRRMLNEMNTFAAILDAAPIVHTRPVGQGKLYIDATGARINAEDELHSFLRHHGIDAAASPFRNLFGLALPDRRLVCGSEFVTEAQRGYQSLLLRHPDRHRDCQAILAGSPNPLGSLSDISRLDGAAALLQG
jgi:hypothetical protein